MPKKKKKEIDNINNIIIKLFHRLFISLLEVYQRLPGEVIANIIIKLFHRLFISILEVYQRLPGEVIANIKKYLLQMQYSHADILIKTIKISQIQIQIINKLTNATRSKDIAPQRLVKRENFRIKKYTLYPKGLNQELSK